MKTDEKLELMKKIKRLGLFLLLVFVPCLVISTLLAVAKVQLWLNMFVLIICMFILYFLYVFICDKLDKRKNARLSKKKDPFSD